MASHCAASSRNVAHLNEKGLAAMRALFCFGMLIELAVNHQALSL